MNFITHLYSFSSNSGSIPDWFYKLFWKHSGMIAHHITVRETYWYDTENIPAQYQKYFRSILEAIRNRSGSIPKWFLKKTKIILENFRVSSGRSSEWFRKYFRSDLEAFQNNNGSILEQVWKYSRKDFGNISKQFWINFASILEVYQINLKGF